jgi:hypothetical protein
LNISDYILSKAAFALTPDPQISCLAKARVTEFEVAAAPK